MSFKIRFNSHKRKFLPYHLSLFLIIALIIFPISHQLEKDSSLKQISKVNLLLPICQKTLCNQVYAKLIAYNGCYDWHTDDPNLVQLEKIQKPNDPNNCFSEVYVYTKSKSVKDITYVSAKDRYSNEIFKCKVGFSEVKTISIENNFDSINVGDVFELHVLAHDEKGNIFSSLEGWKFNWKIISGHNNAQLIKLTEHGKMEIGDKREKIEKEGYQSDKILIKGSQTGKLLVNVEIVEENLKNQIVSNQKELYVIEPFKIIPDKELYIIPNTQYNFDLMYIHSKKIIPSSDHRYFKWSVSDENCGKIKGHGYFYSKDKEMHHQERYLLLSAISDMKGAILENNSLRRLSIILLERGDFKKAHDYLLCASNDAMLYGSRLRSMQAARISPLITQAYDTERARTQRRTNLLLMVISFIALLLVLTIVYTLSLIKKRHQANLEISRMNAELSLHNEEIESMNLQMKESNRIKDEYIGRFLELSSNLILKSEERSKVLNRLARDRKLENLYAELKSQKPLNESVHLFHQNFDTAFLNIYPTFISEINKLLTADNQFEIDENAGKLTTELRILALIRLNISDNQKIADILRSSITTIYTYRSKLKSRAISKDTFEDDVRRIETY